MKYSLDTSAIIHAWRRAYPPDLFPSLWGRVDGLIAQGLLIATEEVKVELERKDDEILAWARERPQMFIPLDANIESAVKDILRNYGRLLDMRKSRSGADPFVIAGRKGQGLQGGNPRTVHRQTRQAQLAGCLCRDEHPFVERSRTH